MSTYTNTLTAKIAVGVVSLIVAAFMLGAVAFTPVPAQAQTNAELEAQIQSLLSTIAALQAQLDGTQTPSGTSRPGCSNTFLRDLSVGSEGQDVMDLQMFLNADADTGVATTGVGSPGQETMYYGPLTADAVSRFQVKYAAQVLTPLGLASGTGYFGASSRSQVRDLCAATTPVGDDDDDDDDDDTLSGGEASLEGYDLMNQISSEDVQEGQTEEVFGAEFDVEDGDVRLSRVEVNVQAEDANTQDEPWRIIDEITLFLDGDEIASMDVDDEDDWSDSDAADGPNTTHDVWQTTFTGLSEVIDEGDTPELTVAVTLAGNIDSEDEDEDWDIWIPNDGIRAVDGEGINHYTGAGATPPSSSDYETFTVEAQEDGDLTVSSSSDDPDPSIIVVDEDSNSGEYTVFAFELEAEDADVEVDEIRIQVDSSSSTIGSLFHNLMIVIDGEEYSYDSITDDTSSTTEFVFEDLGHEIDEDDEVTVEVVAEFQDQDGNYAATGETVAFSIVGSTDIDADGVATGDAISPDGSATGETHSIITTGIAVEVVSTSESVSQIGDTTEERGTFTMKFDVTAVEQDAFIATTTGETVSAGVEFDIIGTANSGTTTSNLTSTADEEDGHFKVNEGDTETFTLTVTHNPDADGFYGVELEEVWFSTTAATADVLFTVPDNSDHETEEEFISG